MKRHILLLTSLLAFVAAGAQPQVIAHRGYWKTDGSAQNSIRALVKADSIGCYGSEFDVWLTADNVLVVNHNADINGVNIENGNSRELLQQRLPNGETLPTLDNFLDAAIPLGVELILEVKPHKDQKREDVAVPMIVDMVKRKGLNDRTTYITFSRHAFDLLTRQSGRPVYFLTGIDPDELKAAGGTGPDYNINVFRKNPDWISRCKALGMPINIWTITDDAGIRYCIDHEAEFITTDIPERTLEMIAENYKPRQITAMTFNLHAGSNASIDEIAEIINDAAPDFVALQELDVFTHRANAPQHNGRNMIADLAAATGMFPLFGRTLDFAGGYYGIGILSKHPCESSRVIELPNPKAYEPRVLLEGTFLPDGHNRVRFACTHLCVEDSVTRSLQADYIARHFSESSCPVILGGDFNSLPQSQAITTLSHMQSVNSQPSTINSQHSTNVSGTAPSFPSDVPQKKLDYIFCMPASAIGDIDCAPLTTNPSASDHLPVISRFTIHYPL